VSFSCDLSPRPCDYPIPSPHALHPKSLLWNATVGTFVVVIVATFECPLDVVKSRFTVIHQGKC